MADIKIKLMANYAEGINKHLRGFGVRGYQLDATGDFVELTIPLSEEADKLTIKEFREMERRVLKIVRFRMIGNVFGTVKITGAELVR